MKIPDAIKNTYIIVLTAFVIWMLFIDSNSWLTGREIIKQEELLEKQKNELQKAIKKDRKLIKKFRDFNEMEKFAREHYFMKKPNEVIYIIEYEDSLKLKEDE